MKSRIDGDIYIFFKTAFTKAFSILSKSQSNSIPGILPFTRIGPSPHGNRQTATAMQQNSASGESGPRELGQSASPAGR